MKLLTKTVRRTLLCFPLAALLSAASVAQEATDKLPVDHSMATGKLPNGLTYYIRNNHRPANKVELRLVVKAGSILEEDDQQGLAHFMEHMNFNGTKNFEKNDLVSYLQSIGVQFGADLNAYTGFDQTVYILPIPLDKADNLEKGFQILEDWAHNATLNDKDIDDERGVVLEESRLGKGADDRMLRKYFPKLTEGTQYADRLPIGKDEIIKRFKYDKIKDFYHEWYRPDLQAVVVVGDIDTNVAKKMIIDHFGTLKNPNPETRRKYETVKPRSEPAAMVVKDKEATASNLSLIYPYVKKHDVVTAIDYKTEIIRALGLQIINHRLNDLAQGENPPFLYAAADFDELIHGFESLNFYCGFSKTGLDSSLNAMAAVILKLKKFGINAPELELVKKEVMAGMDKAYNERTTTESRSYAEECIRNFTDKEPIPGIEAEYGYYKSFLPVITITEVNNVVKNWLTSKNIFSLITAPDQLDVELPTDKALLSMTEEAFQQSVTPVAAQKAAESLMSQKPTPGTVITVTKEEDAFNATTYTLSNGIQLTIKPTNFKSDEIVLTGIKKGGSNSYNLEDRSNVHFATDVVESMGIGDFTPVALEKALAGKNVSVKLSIGDVYDKVTASSNVKDLETMLQLLNLELTRPRRDEGLFKAFKEKSMTSLEFMTSNPRMAFVDTSIKLLYANNPLARMVIPRAADFQNLNMDRAIEIYRSEFGSADGYHFFLVGNVDQEKVLPLLLTYLGSLAGHHLNPTFKDNGVRPITGNQEFTFKKGQEKQSWIFGVYTGQAPYSEDFAAKVQALAEVLNIKVIEDLREKMGGIYTGGFTANVMKEPYERFSIVLQLPCGPENVTKLLDAANFEIDTLKTAGPDPKDLDKVKSQWKEKHTTNLRENSYWNEKLESVLFWGRDKDRVINYEKYIDRLTPADIAQTARTVFNGNNRFLSVLNPE
jgi:zinc protease